MQTTTRTTDTSIANAAAAIASVAAHRDAPPVGAAGSARRSRRALLGQMAALAVLPAVGSLAACTPGGRTEPAGKPAAPATAPAPADAPKSGTAPVPGALKTLEVATVYPYLGYLPLYAAMQRGHLKDRGLALELREFKGGGDAGKAFVGGAADVLIGSYDHVLKLRDQGMDVVAVANVEATYAYALMAKKSATLTGLEALAGTKLGTTGPGSSTDINLRFGLKQRGIDPERGVELISVGGGAPMLAALDNDQIAAGMFLDPLLTQLLQQPERYQVVHDFRSLEYPLLCVTLRRDWLKANEATARSLLAGLVAAESELQADPAAAQAVAREKFGDIPATTLEAAVVNTLPRLSKDGKIGEKAHQTVLDQQLFAGVVSKPVAYTQAVDLSYLPA
ncbi:MAG: ABC transporter substrate-binding protein [Chloroflexi bacterium]|nr:ABC transporter substrate-binding protein [Chloroflexota bacterium]